MQEKDFRSEPAGRILTLPPFENWNGVATSSSPWESASDGNEDVAAPIDAGAVSRCAQSGYLAPRGPGLNPMASRAGWISGLAMKFRQGEPVRWFSIITVMGAWLSAM